VSVGPRWAASTHAAATAPSECLTLVDNLLLVMTMKAIGAGICFCFALLVLFASGSIHQAGNEPGNVSGAVMGKVMVVGACIVAGVSLLSANRKATAWQGSGIVVVLMALAGLGADLQLMKAGELWAALFIQLLIGALGVWLFTKGRRCRKAGAARQPGRNR